MMSSAVFRENIKTRAPSLRGFLALLIVLIAAVPLLFVFLAVDNYRCNNGAAYGVIVYLNFCGIL